MTDDLTPPLCSERDKRAAMTDDEFWSHVFPEMTPEQEASWAAYRWSMDSPDVWVIDCVRCGQTVEVDDPTERERDAFCDDCADETQPNELETS